MPYHSSPFDRPMGDCTLKVRGVRALARSVFPGGAKHAGLPPTPHADRLGTTQLDNQSQAAPFQPLFSRLACQRSPRFLPRHSPLSRFPTKAYLHASPQPIKSLQAN